MNPRRMVLAGVISIACIFGLAEGASAAPGRPTQVVGEYGGLAVEGARQTQEYAEGAAASASVGQEWYEPEELVDTVKRNQMVSIAVGGMLIILLAWKFALN